MKLSDIENPKLRERILQAYSAQNSRRRGNSFVQELQDDRSRQTDNRPAKAKNHGAHNPQFRVSVTLLVADNRGRDGDGAYSTIQDCLIHAVGRLAGLDTGALREAATCVKRTGGCDCNH